MSDIRPPEDGPMLVVDSPYEIARWRPLVQWVLYLPHAFVEYGLRVLAGVATLVYWVLFLFTGRLHAGLYGVITMHERYSQRASGFLLGYSELFAPFDFDQGPEDNGSYAPIRVTFPAPEPPASRWAALNFVFAIPHYVVFALFAVAAAVVAVAGWFAVLFTGAWPRGMRDFLVRVTNYYLRIWAYVYMVEDEYPAFGLID